MQIAVTGGSGRFGRVLVPYLASQGHHVRSLDVAEPPVETSGVDDATADVARTDDLLRALAGCDAVIHLATLIQGAPASEIFSRNVQMSYNVLWACAELGITRVCLASSVNALGGVYSRAGRYDYFPVDEAHPTYVEDPYGLSKWVLEQQADAFARVHPRMRIASLRFHGIVPTPRAMDRHTPEENVKHLWGYTDQDAAARASLLGLTADFGGHEVFYIVAPETTSDRASAELARAHYPSVPLRHALPGRSAFFDCAKAERLLGWTHTNTP